MNEDIIRMARKAGIARWHKDLNRWVVEPGLDRFAALVIANHPPQSFMTWQEGYEAGKQAEREACAKVCDDYDDEYDVHTRQTAEGIALEIRARGDK